MKGIDYQIYLLIIVHENMGWGEILTYFPKKEHRTVGRAINRLVKNNMIGYDRIRGKGKWKRYFLQEENTKNNLLIEIVKGNKKKWKHVRVPVTQRELSKGISWQIDFYRKEQLREWKRTKKTKEMIYYVGYHVALIADCLRWILQLTWAINSGMLGNSEIKLELAKRNKARYEEFLKKIVYNLNEKDEKIMNLVTKAIYHEIMDSLDYKSLSMGKQKGKLIFQLGYETDGKTKYYKTKSEIKS